MEIVWDAPDVPDLLPEESLVTNVRNAVPHVEIHAAERQNPFNVLDAALTVVRVVLAVAHAEVHAIQHALVVVVDVVRVVLEAAVQHVQHDVLMIVIMHALKHVLALAAVR